MANLGDVLMEVYLSTLLVQQMSAFAPDAVLMNWTVGIGLESLVTQHPTESWH